MSIFEKLSVLSSDFKNNWVETSPLDKHLNREDVKLTLTKDYNPGKTKFKVVTKEGNIHIGHITHSIKTNEFSHVNNLSKHNIFGSGRTKNIHQALDTVLNKHNNAITHVKNSGKIYIANNSQYLKKYLPKNSYYS